MSNFTKSIFYSTTVLAVGLIAIFAIYDVVSTQKAATQGLAAIEPASGEGESNLGIDVDAMSDSLNDIKETAGNTLKEAKEDVAEIKDALEKAGDQDIVKEDSPIASMTGVSDVNIDKTISTELETTETAQESIEPAAGTITESITEKGDAVIEKAEDVAEDIGSATKEAAETLPEINTKN